VFFYRATLGLLGALWEGHGLADFSGEPLVVPLAFFVDPAVALQANEMGFVYKSINIL
jgi:hypothetical protein